VISLLREGGVESAQAVAVAGAHPIPSPEAWWSAVLGSGYRGTVDQLDAGAREHVKAQNLSFIWNSDIRSVEANVVYASAARQ